MGAVYMYTIEILPPYAFLVNLVQEPISSQISLLLTWNLEKRLLPRLSDHVPIRRAYVYIYCLIYIQS